MNVKLLAISSVQLIKVMRLVNIVMDFYSRMVEVFQRIIRKLLAIIDVRRFRAMQTVNFDMRLAFMMGWVMLINLIEATTYYKLAADQGHAEGQLRHAVCVERSSCLWASLSEVTNFIRLAADRGGADG
jgi:hypothetical protein